MGKYAKSLPVVMHHFISRYVGLSMSPELFEENCRFMAENGWRGVGLDEAEAFLLGEAPLPAKSFLFTFDDGYLDNYLYAWPILRKYGHKGVIFAVGEAVTAAGRERNRQGPRPTLEDVWSGRIAEADLPDVHSPMRRDALGYAERVDHFFTWEEARIMEASGVMAVAGHSLRHQAVFTGPEYDGFIMPGPRQRPLPPDSTPESAQAPIWGCPAFKTGPELESRAFIPDPALLEALRKLVPQDAAEADAFFRNPKAVAELQGRVEARRGNLGRYESDAEQRERIGKIMRENQELLRNELGHGSRSFCWPWGNGGALARDLGREAGFEVFYHVHRGVNPAGNHLQVNRFRAERKPGSWLLSRSRIYSRPLLGRLYCAIRI